MTLDRFLPGSPPARRAMVLAGATAILLLVTQFAFTRGTPRAFNARRNGRRSWA